MKGMNMKIIIDSASNSEQFQYRDDDKFIDILNKMGFELTKLEFNMVYKAFTFYAIDEADFSKIIQLLPAMRESKIGDRLILEYSPFVSLFWRPGDEIYLPVFKEWREKNEVLDMRLMLYDDYIE